MEVSLADGAIRRSRGRREGGARPLCSAGSNTGDLDATDRHARLPYVRRVAISLHLLELRFQHEPVSVFRGFEAFHAINPVVKAPTLIADEGTVLMESTLILAIRCLERSTTG